MSVTVLVLLLSFAIPVLGIGLAGYQEWLKFRAKQQELGASTKDVEETIQTLQERLERMEQERDALIQRVQNLETIVTSETWDALHNLNDDPSSLSETSDSSELQPSPNHTEQTPTTQEQTKELARRLRT